jgi:hypothetical protein
MTTKNPTSQEEDHDPARVAHRGPRHDHDQARRRGPGRRHPVPRDPDPRLREVHRGPALLRDAVDHVPHLRHLPGQPPARLVQGMRRNHGRAHSGDRGQAARTAPLRSVRAVARAVLLPPLRPRPAAGHGLGSGQAQRGGVAREQPARCATESRCASSASRSSRGSPASGSTLRGPCRAASTPRSIPPRESRRWRVAGGAGDRQADPGPLEEDVDGFPRDRVVLQLPDDVLRPRRPGRLAAPLRRQSALRRRRRQHRRRPGSAGRLRDAYRRGDALGLVPEGAVLQAGRLSRRHLSRRSAGSPERRGSLRNARSGQGARGVPPAFGRIVESGFHYHYARLIEALYALERMQELLDDPKFWAPRCEPTPVSTPSRASASSRPRAAL